MTSLTTTTTTEIYITSLTFLLFSVCKKHHGSLFRMAEGEIEGKRGREREMVMLNTQYSVRRDSMRSAKL